jgi:hypothetical protein
MDIGNHRGNESPVGIERCPMESTCERHHAALQEGQEEAALDFEAHNAPAIFLKKATCHYHMQQLYNCAITSSPLVTQTEYLDSISTRTRQWRPSTNPLLIIPSHSISTRTRHWGTSTKFPPSPIPAVSHSQWNTRTPFNPHG